jgi:hypothetical protein
VLIDVCDLQWAVRHRDLICILTRVANSVLILGHVVPGIPWSWSNPGNEQPMPYYITRMVSSVQMCIIAVVLKYIEHAVSRALTWSAWSAVQVV